MGEAEPGGPLWRRVLLAWSDMRGAMRWLMARRPDETTILVFLVVSGVIGWIGGVARAWLGGGAAGGAERPELVGTILGGLVFFGLLWPLLLYLLALGGHGLARLAGGQGSGRDSRAATAWAALVVSPPALVAGTLAVVLQRAGAESAGAVLGALPPLAFLWAIGHCFAEVHGFARAWTVMAAIGAAILLLAGLPALVLRA